MKRCETTLTHGQMILTWPHEVTDDDISDLTELLMMQLRLIRRVRVAVEAERCQSESN